MNQNTTLSRSRQTPASDINAIFEEWAADQDMSPDDALRAAKALLLLQYGHNETPAVREAYLQSMLSNGIPEKREPIISSAGDDPWAEVA